MIKVFRNGTTRADMNIPTRYEIDPDDDEEASEACEHFLGKTVQTIFEELCRGSSWYYSDFIWMGPLAFRYYFPALASYVQSKSADNDCVVLIAVIGAIDFHLDNHSSESKELADDATFLCRYIIEHIEKFNCDLDQRRIICHDLNRILGKFSKLLGQPQHPP